MVHKCTRVLGILKQHQFELEVLEKLLDQRLWLRGKRGRWHDRRTLILMTYCGKEGDVMKKALNAAVEALEDNDTHLCQWLGRLDCIYSDRRNDRSSPYACPQTRSAGEEVACAP
jgi:Fanconi-associated nuclease 1